MNSIHEQKVAVFLGAIACGLLSVRQIRQFVAGAKAAPFPTQKTLAVVAAAQEALTRHQASARRAQAQPNNRNNRKDGK
jgi:hypothetical protein